MTLLKCHTIKEGLEDHHMGLKNVQAKYCNNNKICVNCVVVQKEHKRK